MTTPGYDGSVKIDTKLDTKGFNKGVQSMAGGFEKLGAIAALGFGAIIAIVGVAIAKVGQFGVAAVGAASNVEEMQSKFNIVFGAFASRTEKQLADFANAANRSKNELMGFAASAQDTLVPLGFARDAAADMSVGVVKLSQDLASFNNIDPAQAFYDLKAAMIGEYEPVRKYGAILNVVTVQQEALRLKIWDGVGALSAQARAQAALSLIAKSNTDAQGDAVRTAGSWANQMRGLSAAWGDFQVAVGKSIIIFAPLIGVVKNAIMWLTTLANMFAEFIALLFGVNVSVGDAAANVNAVADAGDGLGTASDNAGGLADNIKKAGDAAKGALGSFDSLNVLQMETKTPDGNGNGNGGGGTGGKLPIPTPDPTIMADVLAKMEEWKVKLLQMFASAKDAFAGLQKALKPLGKLLFAGLKWAWDNVLVPLGKWSIKSLLPAFLKVLTEVVKAVTAALIVLKPVGLWLWESFLKPMSEFAGDAILWFLKHLANGYKIIGDYLTKNPKMFEDIINGFKGMKNPLDLVGQGINEVVRQIGIMIADAQHLFNTVSDGAKMYYEKITTQWGQMWTWFVNNVITPLSNQFTGFWTSVGNKASNAWDVVQLNWTNAKTWFINSFVTPTAAALSTLWANVSTQGSTAWTNIKSFWDKAGTFFSGVGTNIKSVFSSAWTSVKTTAETMWSTVSNLFRLGYAWVDTNVTQPLKKAFGDALSAIGTVFSSTFNGIATSIKGIMNGIIGMLNSMLSNATSGINGLIDGVNAIGAWIPGWTDFPHINAPQIPLLAKGAVIPPNAQFMAILGDQKSGRNIETPESLMRQVVREESGAGGGPMTATLRAKDGDALLSVLARLLYVELEYESRRKGNSSVLGGEPR